MLEALHAPITRRGSGVSIDYPTDALHAPILPQKYTAWGEAEFANFVAMLGQGGDVQSEQDYALVPLQPRLKDNATACYEFEIADDCQPLSYAAFVRP